ncbi:MAG: fibro-slime domain-containing protein [Fibrobacter sp.]|uniref:fibro-slime domain-containing protein n=1 Tax=Fibrobacter sp. TaxID=35828 RepID=UPI0025BCFE09|nr:fibro-slime domain-containing protein [Fibrobacter sp.]MBR4785665.1 fibro-slime domain-containing protein [Fibrobacter sp.]
MNKIMRLGIVGLLAFAVFGCDSPSDASRNKILVGPESDLQDDEDLQGDEQKGSSSSHGAIDSVDSSEDAGKVNSQDGEQKVSSSSRGAIDPVDASEDIKELEIVLRDFEAGYPDFDNFQSAAYASQTSAYKNFDTWVYPGYADNADWMARREIPGGYATYGCGNHKTPEYGTPVLENSAQVWYGEFRFCDEVDTLMRGFVHDLCSDAIEDWGSDSTHQCNKRCHGLLWSERVYITSNMVKPVLSFPKGEDGKPDLHEPNIAKARDACDNKYFEQWFTDNDLNKRSDGTLPLTSLDANSMGISYDWNNGGFYPLDSISDRSEFVSINPKYPNQFGPQSLTIYCPPYKYEYASTQNDNRFANTYGLCSEWLLNGGPRVGDAAINAAMAVNIIGLWHLRNAGYTMMGYAPFKYKKDAGKVFEFTSQDDLWVFVDGVLALDLGGTHLPARGKVDLKSLASEGHGCHAGDPLKDYCEGRVDDKGAWKDGSWHHIHIFYANRSSEGSALYLKF